jgi:hypothetical protein
MHSVTTRHPQLPRMTVPLSLSLSLSCPMLHCVMTQPRARVQARPGVTRHAGGSSWGCLNGGVAGRSRKATGPRQPRRVLRRLLRCQRPVVSGGGSSRNPLARAGRALHWRDGLPKDHGGRRAARAQKDCYETASFGRGAGRARAGNTGCTSATRATPSTSSTPTTSGPGSPHRKGRGDASSPGRHVATASQVQGVSSRWAGRCRSVAPGGTQCGGRQVQFDAIVEQRTCAGGEVNVGPPPSWQGRFTGDEDRLRGCPRVLTGAASTVR